MPISTFYHYKSIDDVDDLAAVFCEFGKEFEVAGRIRVSEDGINAALGGDEEAVNAFHQLVLDKLENPKINFQMAVGGKQHFPNGWRVRICKEIVTLGVDGGLTSLNEAAPHISPEDFKVELEKGDAVILDVRNCYEHAIGRFEGAIVPDIRAFSNLPKFLADNVSLFEGKRVLMYCTGGVRCETASAYLKNICAVESIGQLDGGIDNFLRQYPDGGGIFAGKNLVFDTRMAVKPIGYKVVGQCVICMAPWDDYSSNWRCSFCRIRMIICEKNECMAYMTSGAGLCKNCKEKD